MRLLFLSLRYMIAEMCEYSVFLYTTGVLANRASLASLFVTVEHTVNHIYGDRQRTGRLAADLVRDTLNHAERSLYGFSVCLR